MKQLILLCTVILFCNNLSAQSDDIYYSASKDTTETELRTVIERTPGDWLIISANRHQRVLHRLALQAL